MQSLLQDDGIKYTYRNLVTFTGLLSEKKDKILNFRYSFM